MHSTKEIFTEAELAMLSGHYKNGGLVVKAVNSRYNSAYNLFAGFMANRGNEDLFLESMTLAQATTLMCLYVVHLYNLGMRDEQISGRLVAVHFAFRIQVPAPRNTSVFQEASLKDAISCSGRNSEEAAAAREDRKKKSKMAWNWHLMNAACDLFKGEDIPAGGFSSTDEMDRKIVITSIKLMFDSSLRPCAVCSAEGKEEDHTFKRQDVAVRLLEKPEDGEQVKAKRGKGAHEDRLIRSDKPLWDVSHDSNGLRRKVEATGIRFAPTSSKVNRRGAVTTPEVFWLVKGRSVQEDKLVDDIMDVLTNIPGTASDDIFTRAFFADTKEATKAEGIKKYFEENPATRAVRVGTRKFRKSHITTATRATAEVMGWPADRFSARSMRAGGVQFRLLQGMKNEQELLTEGRVRGGWAEGSKVTVGFYSRDTEVSGIFGLTKTEEDENVLTMDAFANSMREVETGVTDDLVADSDSDEEEGASAESAKQAARAAAFEKKAADSAAKKEIKSAESKEKKRVANEDKAKEKERAKKKKGEDAPTTAVQTASRSSVRSTRGIHNNNKSSA